MTSSNNVPTSINLFGIDMYPDYLDVYDKWTNQLIGEFVVAAGMAFPYDDDGIMFDFGVVFNDGRSDKQAVCDVCNIDKGDAYLRWA